MHCREQDSKCVVLHLRLVHICFFKVNSFVGERHSITWPAGWRMHDNTPTPT